MSVRWLHLSDFHVGKDNYGQISLFREILAHVKVRVDSGLLPHVIFLTGDIANKGKTSEYSEFRASFLQPLLELFPADKKPFVHVIPGNHDVDRTESKATLRYGVLAQVPTFLDPTVEGLKERKSLLDRFRAFGDAGLRGEWVLTEKGYSASIHEIDGVQVGVVCVNTAWLSGGDSDRSRLNLGLEMLRDALDEISGAKIKFVLGHHPIAWLEDEAQEPVRTLLGRSNVMYLHGHMHRNSANQEIGGGRSYITLQCGAAFQAREDELWVNRFIWGECDLDKLQVVVEPLKWSRSQQSWIFDNEALAAALRIPGEDKFAIPFFSSAPNQQATRVDQVISTSTPTIPGWINIDGEFLRNKRQNLDNDEMLSFFDGRVPTWKDALSDAIPRRGIVSEITSELRELNSKKCNVVTVVLGAGGEGKSTAVRQAVVDIVGSGEFNVIWHTNASYAFPPGVHELLPVSNRRWLIVSDEADLIAEQTFNLVKSLHDLGRTDFTFLLSCRDTDWIAAKGDQRPWGEVAHVTEKRLRGLSMPDAEKVVSAWSNLGTVGLGRLSGVDRSAAVRELFQASQLESNQSREGAFLGAMLRVRYGDRLKSRVKTLLSKLSEQNTPAGPLLDAFAYIAVPHSENILFLTPEILGEAMGASTRQTRLYFVRPLGEEAAAVVNGQYILTRHRAIAEAASEILSSDYDFDTEQIILDLTRAAIVLNNSGDPISNLVDWRYLSDVFFDRGRTRLGLRLAKLLTDLEPLNPFYLVKLSQLLRRCGQPENSVELFRHVQPEMKKTRALFCEWATAEGLADFPANSAVLATYAVADRIASQRVDNEVCKISFTGLANNYYVLHEKYNRNEFLLACKAAVQVGLKIPQDERSGVFRSIGAKISRFKVPDAQLPESIERLRVAAQLASEYLETELPEFLPKVDGLAFKDLHRLFESTSSKIIVTQSEGVSGSNHFLRSADSPVPSKQSGESALPQNGNGRQGRRRRHRNRKPKA